MYNNNPTAATKMAARNIEFIEQRRRRAARIAIIKKYAALALLAASILTIIIKY